MPTAIFFIPDAKRQKLLEKHFSSLGWHTAVEPTATSFVERARSEEADLLVIEADPELIGDRVIADLKLDRRTNLRPILRVDGAADNVPTHDHVMVNAEVTLTEPLTLARLRSTLEVVEEQRQRRRDDRVTYSIQFRFFSHPGNLEATVQLFSHLLEHASLPEKQIKQLRTAILEIGQNAIEWGNKHDATKTVTVSVEVGDDKIEIVVEDEGEGFNPGELPHAADGKEDPIAHMEVRQNLGLREGGFGIQIVRGVVDQVRYNARGNKVTLVKHLTPRSAPPPDAPAEIPPGP